MGMMTGDTAVAEKNTTIANRPGSRKRGSILLPTTNARKKKDGNSRPKINVGPLV